ncbi:DUF3857 and transglutaminase domain-containing protein [Flavobacterium sp. JLP]|uniref:DUF3857 domain-containing protein n=1 Tax=Flavobacterium sp. JLP TaxID=2783793 RepID=UPI00188B613F|nr:DUF3857 domain-containing protein [Flavobacterium sp. JLP]MBF4508343.1 DUF3857 and transglutaminase domain-containing protein [Flavobacterium sp. JLP]
MKFRHLAIVVFLFIGFLKINAQNFEMGKVTIAELEEKKHPIDSAASAAILFSKGTVDIKNTGSSETSVQMRIKIYKKEGYNWSNVQFAFPSGKLSAISITEVYTYNLVDGKIVKSKLKPEGEFLEKSNKNYWIKKITFPDVREGSIIEYQFKNYGGALNIRDWDFQKSIPVNYSEFKTIIPDSFVFKRNTTGFFSPKIKTQVANTYGYLAIENIYSLQNLPAMKEEEYVNNINNYRASISHELETIAIPGQIFKSFSSNWSAVAKTIYEYENFGLELNKTGYFEEDLKLLLQAKLKSEDKMTAILNYVKSNIKWNNHFGYGCDQGVRKAYKEKTGNCADINLMLTAMLRYSGLEAHPVLISTRSNGITFFPNIDAFNYVIAAVETPNGNVLLDATDEFSTLNILPLRDLNWVGRLIRKDGTSDVIDLMPKKTSNDLVTMSFEITEQGKVEGKARRQYSDYNALSFRQKTASEKEEAYIEEIENKNSNIEISEYKRVNQNEFLLPVSESFSFTGSNLAEVIDGKIYLNPMLFFLSEKNPFKQEKREYPVDFGFPFCNKYTITIKLPENFTVENLPESTAVVMEDNLGAFKFDIAFTDNLIQISMIHQINEAIFPIEKYEMLKEYYKTMLAKQSEKIVLKRI